MPPPQHRKVAFSSKRKKEQLKAKKERKRQVENDNDEVESSVSKTNENKAEECKLVIQNQTKAQNKLSTAERYRLLFQNESKNEIEKRKRNARLPLREKMSDVALEVDLDTIYKPGSLLDMPKRPQWNYEETKFLLESREQAYFKEYVENILKTYCINELSYFECNIETWRQLWRVLEMSDIVLLIADIRHPTFHFSPALYDYVTKDLERHIILVLNKIDLVPPSLVTAWRHYFLQKFPQLKVVCFSSFPKTEAERASEDHTSKMLHKRKRSRATVLGPRQLFETCEEIVKDKVNLKSWKQKIESQFFHTDGDSSEPSRVVLDEEDKSDQQRAPLFHRGILTIGCCGYPNVGKSSLINGLVGRKVVSVSRTPGHTKHFQTIYLTPTVKLCDCPGLVFPALVDKSMQVLAGIYPIAQLREPYSAITYLAERLPLVQLLGLKHPDCETIPMSSGDQVRWSAYDICYAWAEKRGFYTAKASRPDIYRAANNILRFALEGRLCLFTFPPQYNMNKAKWESHPETLWLVQEQSTPQVSQNENDQEDFDLSEEDEQFSNSNAEDNSDSNDDDADNINDDDVNVNQLISTISANKFDLLTDD